MYIGPGSEKTWNFEKYPDDPEGKWDKTGKTSYGCVSFAETSNHEWMYQFLGRRLEERGCEHMHFSASD